MLQSLLKKIFGDRNEKAMKELWPIVDEIKNEYEKITLLSDDQLKAKTVEFKEKIQNHTEKTREQIEEITTQLHKDDFEGDRVGLYDELDELKKRLDEEYEEILDVLLPEAFAVVKETSKRLVGKSWDAAGYTISWDDTNKVYVSAKN